MINAVNIIKPLISHYKSILALTIGIAIVGYSNRNFLGRAFSWIVESFKTTKKTDEIAKDALNETKEKLAKLLKEYDIVYITPGLNLEEIDCFLLGEEHEVPQLWELNGAFIQAVSDLHPIVYKEGISSMEELTLSEKEKYCQKLKLPSSTKIFGWDASDEVRGLSIAGAGLVELNLAATRKKIEESLKDIEEYKATIRDMNSLKIPVGYAAANMCRTAIEKSTELIELLHKQERFLKMYFDKGIKEIRNSIRSTFPDRTKAMVATLKKLGGTTSKVFFIAGVFHLRSSPICSGAGYDLNSMYEELIHHKAAILIPKLCKLQTKDELMLDNIKLPEGLVLSEEQIADFKEKLSSLEDFEDKEQVSIILDNSIMPIINTFTATKVQGILNALKHPEGFVPTEEQNNEIQDRLYIAILNNEDTKTILSNILKPIYISFFSNNPSQ